MNNDRFIVIDRVSKEFGAHGKSAAVRVIDDVSMKIGRGEFIVFLGPSGCGKTTLMRIVGGLEAASCGQVRLDGATVTGPDRKKGMVFQSYSSFPWLDVIGNIRFGMRFRDDISAAEKERLAQYYLELVGLRGFEGYRVNRISGGMRQRLAIARTLAAGPDVLLMDEPFGALDAQNREFLQEQLVGIQKSEQKTVIFVTHDVEEAIFLADRIMLFSARPARVLQEIRVGDHIGTQRPLAVKSTQAFFALRNSILDVTRRLALQTEKIMLQGGMFPA
ncbi:MAG: Bicarbonate transport ATP-binding protein CmpD [Gammaproteobacteria bacterium]|nr:Bicarbonate transport ATP-binding protein CmpD [Gammaproteobacteria bacterium]